MAEKLTRKYGLLTSVCLVVGTVIGSGIFFRNDTIFPAIGGNMWIGVAAWIVGGLITLSLAYVFSVLATQHEQVDGISGFARKLVGEKYAYIFDWYLTLIFFPAITGVLAWVSGRFTVELIGRLHVFEEGVNHFFSGHTYLFGLVYLISIYAINALSPKLAEWFHVSCTFIKVVPLILMGVIGTIVGIVTGTTIANIGTYYVPTIAIEGNPFFVALLATAFAYLGWDVVISLSKEIINVKKNLPIALVAGLFIIIAVYVAFFIGLFSAAPVDQLTGGSGVMTGFINIFTEIGGTVLFGFIIISCLGTLNGLVSACGRMFYSLATKDQGPKKKLLASLDAQTLMPANSMVLGLVVTSIWMLVFGANLAPELPNFSFSVPDLVPVSFMGMMIPIMMMAMVKETKLGLFNRIIAPLAGIVGAGFSVYAIIYQRGESVIHFLMVFVVLTIIGLILNHYLSLMHGLIMIVGVGVAYVVYAHLIEHLLDLFSNMGFSTFVLPVIDVLSFTLLLTPIGFILFKEKQAVTSL